MSPSPMKTPGVYIVEENAFPNSVVPVATAVPAFIGYTPKAEYSGKSLYNKAHKIASFAEFQALYLLDNPPPPAEPAVQYAPQFYLVAQAEKPAAGPCVQVNGTWYAILPDPGSIYYLYNSIRLFYENGGGPAYIVAVDGYGEPTGTPLAQPGMPLVNPNVRLDELKAGLDLLKEEPEPTLLVCPEANLLSPKEQNTLMQAMLGQAEEMGSRFCILDVKMRNGKDEAAPNPSKPMDDIAAFRAGVGDQGLSYGAAYYPFLGTGVMQRQELNYTNLFGGDTKPLGALLNPEDAPNPGAAALLAQIEKPPDPPLTTGQMDKALSTASKPYAAVMQAVLAAANLLPPSGGIAGVYAMTDNTRGVWKAPANTSVAGVASLPVELSHTEQEDLNVDPLSGKSINAIRSFIGQGTLIWGARTLAGNSQDWRYISARRTAIFLEQSIHNAIQAYVFEPNEEATWRTVGSMLDNFLTNVWKQGGLAGATPEEAFQVDVGLGKTMTPEDILDGLLRVTVLVALIRPYEFVELTFSQQMAK